MLGQWIWAKQRILVKTNKEDSLEKQDFDLFAAIEAIDKKDYGYFDRLSSEQQKKFSSYMLLHYASSVSGKAELQNYCLRSVDYYANMHMFNENVQKHPKLQWLMLCASSPGMGKQFHPWIPQIKDRVVKLRDQAKVKDIKDYFNKIYPGSDKKLVDEISESYVAQQKRKYYLAQRFPTLKLDEIQVLSDIITNEDIREYEKDSGNEI